MFYSKIRKGKYGEKIRHGADGHMMRRHWPEQEQWKKRQEAITGSRDMMRERKEHATMLGTRKNISSAQKVNGKMTMCFSNVDFSSASKDELVAIAKKMYSMLTDDELHRVLKNIKDKTV